MYEIKLKTCENTGQSKREDYIDWEEYFMGIALLAAERSKDPECQVGACVVNKENLILGIGYNGFPIGCSDDDFPWDKNNSTPLDSKLLYVCHAEMNAIMNKNSADLKNCTMYVTRFPCNECAKLIIQSGIREVVYLTDKNIHKKKYAASIRMFEKVGIKNWKYIPKRDKIVINFTKMDPDSNLTSPSK